jgi:uncharacterized membrane protein YcfT
MSDRINSKAIASNARLEWLDVARGIAMLMVVSSHAIEWTDSASVSEVSAWVHSINASAQLPVFFCVSGILFTRSLSLTWSDLFRRRVLPLLWVFVIWQPVVFLYKFVAGQFLPGQEDSSLGAHVLRLAASPLRPSGELWFLWALAVFVVAAYLTRKFHVVLQLVLAGALSAVWLASMTSLVDPTVIRLLGPGLNGLPTYYFFFLLGVLGASHWKQFADSSRWIWATAIAVWGASIIVARLTPAGDWIGAPFALKILGLFGCMSVALVLSRSTLLQIIGIASINIYLLHTSLIVAVLVPLEVSGIATIPWQWWGAFALVLIATLAGLLFRRLNTLGHLKWLVELPQRLAGLRNTPAVRE